MFYTYVIQSEKDKSFYIGSCESLVNRLDKHNKGYSRYTKNKRPWKLAYKEEHTTRSEARKREYNLKSLKSRKVILELIKAGPVV